MATVMTLHQAVGRMLNTHPQPSQLQRDLFIDFRRQIIQGELEDFTCLLGTMVQEAYETNPRIRQACDVAISNHASVIAKDIAEAKKLHAPSASFDAEELALFTQVVMQGAFVMAKAKHGPQMAEASIVHLRRYIEFLFGKNPNAR